MSEHDRRNFFRLTAGGGMAVVAGTGARCSQRPADAVAAWKGPGAETRRASLDPWRAILAPHAHNLQSWLVDLRTPDETCCAAT